MRLIFVHGWSVTNTDTYGELPEALGTVASSYGLALEVQHLYLGKYVSFHDEVTLDDIARALNRALRDLPVPTENLAPHYVHWALLRISRRPASITGHADRLSRPVHRVGLRPAEPGGAPD